ncbi:phage major capsid protein [Azorhizobium doebereinerae]|uniref:phage major capsid protein n=1 Tax=Azorhizobium doebereinerae TaxID=281091 RepID=UPI000407B908|nr:phage major capsid protein [Azorhizobium doebereinerae]
MFHCIPAPQGVIERKGEEDDPAAIVTKALDTFKGEVIGRLDKVEAKAGSAEALVSRLDKMEARLNRPGTGGTSDGPADVTEERKAFGTYLRRGDKGMPETELKALNVSTDTQGGYLAPVEISTEFVRDLTEFSPIRALASVRTTSSPAVTYPKRTGITNAKWKGELQAAEASEPGFAQLEIPVREVNTFVDISNQLLADSAGVAEAEVRLALAEDFGQKEGAAFVKGDGVLEPVGLLTDPAVTALLNGHATNLATDALISLMYALPAAYRNRGTWLLNGTTLATIRKLKDGQGNYLWQPAFQAGQPETILGRPVVEAVDMPDVAANATPILFGDFGTAYRIVDRVALSILVNPYLLATNGITRIHATRRVGAGVVQPKALRKLKMAVS